MANLYTDLYGTVSVQSTSSGAISSTSSRIYKGPALGQKGATLTRTATYTGTIATTDVLHICGGIRTGEKLVSLDVSFSTDPDSGNDITVDIGTTTDPDGILNDSTAFQGATDLTVYTSGQAVPTLLGVDGDEYILTATNATETSAVITFTIVTAI
jgi:hypothetical protein